MFEREIFMYYDNDVIEHHGVLGMKWGVRHDKTSSGSSSKSSARAAKKAAVKSAKSSYSSDKGPKKGVFNIANSAARTYYRAQKASTIAEYTARNNKAERKAAGLTSDQVKNGRYRVARARNIKRKAASVALAAGVATLSATTCGAGGVAMAPFLGVGLATVNNYATGAHYYAKEQATYGRRRAKTSLKSVESSAS